MTAGDVLDVGALWQVIWVSLVSGLALVAAMSLAIIGFARAAHERREGRASAAGGYYAIAVAGVGVVGAAVVLGVVIMLSKG
jgi:uncharacterized membrane protein